MRISYLAALVLACTAMPAFAQTNPNAVTDPNMSCADYLKLEASAGPTPTTGDASTDKMAADIDKKMSDYCKKNPTAKAVDAAQQILMQ